VKSSVAASFRLPPFARQDHARSMRRLSATAAASPLCISIPAAFPAFRHHGPQPIRPSVCYRTMADHFSPRGDGACDGRIEDRRDRNLGATIRRICSAAHRRFHERCIRRKTPGNPLVNRLLPARTVLCIPPHRSHLDFRLASCCQLKGLCKLRAGFATLLASPALEQCRKYRSSPHDLLSPHSTIRKSP